MSHCTREAITGQVESDHTAAILISLQVAGYTQTKRLHVSDQIIGSLGQRHSFVIFLRQGHHKASILAFHGAQSVMTLQRKMQFCLYAQRTKIHDISQTAE